MIQSIASVKHVTLYAIQAAYNILGLKQDNIQLMKHFNSPTCLQLSPSFGKPRSETCISMQDHL